MALNEWYVLARLAELVERGEAKFSKHSSLGNTHHFLVTSEHVIENGSSDEEQGQLCEMLSGRFMERAISLGVTGEKKRYCLSEQNCITCLALPGDWCRPTHEGERDSGGWIHPERESGDSIIGALRDAKHISSAMHRFSQMHFSSKRTRGIAYAQILHAGLKFGLDMSYWSSNATSLMEAARVREEDDIFTARGEALDTLAFDRMSIGRFYGETDDALRERTRVGNRLRRFNTTPVADNSWVGMEVALADAVTVMRITNSEQQAYGRVNRVNIENFVSTVDVIPY